MEINLENLELKKLEKNDLRTLVDWAKKEGWNPGENDFDVFWKTDPDGYYGFYFEDKLIAGGAIISYNQEFGFMGLFIVQPSFRDQGIGKKLWYLRRDLLIRRLNDDATIGMDGTGGTVNDLIISAYGGVERIRTGTTGTQITGSFALGTSGTEPTSSGDAGEVGEVRYTDNYIYIKTSAGWKRANLSAIV